MMSGFANAPPYVFSPSEPVLKRMRVQPAQPEEVPQWDSAPSRWVRLAGTDSGSVGSEATHVTHVDGSASNGVGVTFEASSLPEFLLPQPPVLLSPSPAAESAFAEAAVQLPPIWAPGAHRTQHRAQPAVIEQRWSAGDALAASVEDSMVGAFPLPSAGTLRCLDGSACSPYDARPFIGPLQLATSCGSGNFMAVPSAPSITPCPGTVVMPRRHYPLHPLRETLPNTFWNPSASSDSSGAQQERRMQQQAAQLLQRIPRPQRWDVNVEILQSVRSAPLAHTNPNIFAPSVLSAALAQRFVDLQRDNRQQTLLSDIYMDRAAMSSVLAEAPAGPQSVQDAQQAMWGLHFAASAPSLAVAPCYTQQKQQQQQHLIHEEPHTYSAQQHTYSQQQQQQAIQVRACAVASAGTCVRSGPLRPFSGLTWSNATPRPAAAPLMMAPPPFLAPHPVACLPRRPLVAPPTSVTLSAMTQICNFVAEAPVQLQRRQGCTRWTRSPGFKVLPAGQPAEEPHTGGTQSLSAPALCERWARTLELLHGESLLLAMDLWTRVRPLMTIAALQGVGAPRPLETALACCLWIASKMEECRYNLPTTSEVAGMVGCNTAAMNDMELYILGLCDWRPTRGWQERRTAHERQHFEGPYAKRQKSIGAYSH